MNEFYDYPFIANVWKRGTRDMDTPGEQVVIHRNGSNCLFGGSVKPLYTHPVTQTEFDALRFNGTTIRACGNCIQRQAVAS
jgi:hypothetical protein